MKKNKFDQSYWEQRYDANEIGWNIGYSSTPLKTYIDQLEDKSINILIPGAGNSYEAEYLWNAGFKNTYVLDIALQPLVNLKSRVTGFPKDQLLHHNFFEFEGQFDLILEQTFFCALDPSLREKYVKKMVDLLKPKGKLSGLFFDFPLTSSGPPFGGSIEEYKIHFSPYFEIKILERSTNSIKPREGKELFFIFERR
ncbi:methyltransferase domain-containing protein [Winogradskyella tangerina]|uniref:methyltransferase domain-containing protein n=1 Tax=Winogradskyella tangerina TaxID=2023240 RepID=UPI000DBE6A10|nr:methyltransferase domain-containing protein [Winogradskyella tangerina]